MPARPQLHLAPHVRACHCNGQVILLDLRKGKYLGVGGRGLPALAREVQGWPPVAHAEGSDTDSPDVDGLTAPLIAQGLLTSAPPASAHRRAAQEATSSLDADDVAHETRTGYRRVLRFLLSASRASLSLRFCSLLTIADRVASRRAAMRRHEAPIPESRLKDAVGAYLKLRPLAFTAHDRCLYDSLTLLHFLAGEGIPATWVLGVKTGPFGAHAWVQRDDLVLSDLHEHVRAFQPILTV